MFNRLSFLTFGLGVIGTLLATVIFFWLVVFEPGEQISQGNIEKILAVESPVYYSDGINKIGVFFEDAHRQYIPFVKIPKNFISGIVAAEDNKFFEHHGIDYIGILRAVFANLKAGRIVQGGSTITQQTAKNLFKRRDRSIGAKLKELLYAWRLEYHYPKEKILEFYANQFYVSGNGRGLGVAARYYFDKPVGELSLLECAFVAGSVKRPNYYNPFTAKTEEASFEARSRAKLRVKYVLGQMLKHGMISQAEFDEYIDKEIPFKQGQMYYSLNTIMDMVKDSMAGPELEAAFNEHGIDNVATSGIKIITTIEKNIQEESHYALRKELSRLDIRLLGYDRLERQQVYADLPFASLREQEKRGFLVGRITSIDQSDSPKVCVSFNSVESGGKSGCIDYKGLKNLLDPLVKYERQLWSQARKNDLPLILDRLKVGDLVYVSIRDIDADSGQYVLDLEKYPLIQGASIAIKEGTIRALAGGMENRYYNRAIRALRPMGSVIKPLVYAAALQLGWNSMDVLNNVRDVFVYQNMPYFPRPDHKSPYEGVSMSWAGVHSENVATVWLLYHLCDHLSPGQFRELLVNLGMDQMPGESDGEYRRRVRDDMGIVVDQETLYQVAFAKAVGEMEPDLIFAGKLKEYEILRRLHFGTDFEEFLLQEEESLSDEDEIDNDESEEIDAPRSQRDTLKRKAELAVRKEILGSNFLRYKKFWEELKVLRVEMEPRQNDESLLNPDQSMQFEDFTPTQQEVKSIVPPFGENSEAAAADEAPTPATGSLYYDVEAGQYLYTDHEPMASWELVSRPQLQLALASGPKGDGDFWGDVLVDGRLSVATIELLNETIDKEFAKLSNIPPYSPEVLHNVSDFRVLTGLKYLKGFCRKIGIASKLDPVLSFPLGSNVISIFEVTRAYEGMITGKVRANVDTAGSEGLSLIDRIEGSDGETIFIPERKARRIVAPEISLAVSDILRKVVKFGTGRYADRNVRLHSHDRKREKQLMELDLSAPVVGKTGTANRFTNASFAGVVPVMDQAGHFTLEDGYVLATYVGFDDNTPMVRNTTHITGSAGALPLWTRIANAILLDKEYAERLDLEDLSFSGTTEVPLTYRDYGQVEVGVDVTRGGIVTGDQSKATIITFGDEIAGGRLKPARFFRPYWILEED